MDRISAEGLREKNGFVQVNFRLADGERFRISVADAFNERNIRKWSERLNGPNGIKARVKLGCFDLAAEFPDYRFMKRVAPQAAADGAKILAATWESFKADCEFKIKQREMAPVTLNGYRKIYNRHWAKLAARPFYGIKLSELRAVAAKFEGTKKTYNNVVSAIRVIFAHGYMDKPQDNPALGLTCVKLRAKDMPEIDPYSIGEAETLIAALHEQWGEAQGNYDELRFFTGMRPSEQIALEVSDCDAQAGTIKISKAVVEGKFKDYTKNGIDRIVELNGRAFEVLRRQLALRARLMLAGKLERECKALFFNEGTGKAFHDLQVQLRRWNATQATLKMRARDAYNARHSSVSWNLMVDPNKLLWIAEQHGHSVAVMLKKYARWTKGAKDADVAAIKRAMEQRPQSLRKAA